MRSALGYMVKRGLLAGVGITMVIALLVSLSSSLGIHHVFMESAGNNPILAGLAYLVPAFVLGAFGGSIPGAIIGLLNGMYINRFIRRNYAQITNSDDYIRQISLRSAGFTAILTLPILFVFNISIDGMLTLLLTGIAGGLIGRGYAYHDMAQRREKKHALKAEANDDAMQHKAKRRLALPDVNTLTEAEYESTAHTQQQKS